MIYVPFTLSSKVDIVSVLSEIQIETRIRFQILEFSPLKYHYDESTSILTTMMY